MSVLFFDGTPTAFVGTFIFDSLYVLPLPFPIKEVEFFNLLILFALADEFS